MHCDLDSGVMTKILGHRQQLCGQSDFLYIPKPQLSLRTFQDGSLKTMIASKFTLRSKGEFEFSIFELPKFNSISTAAS